jgi:hypothetical protein
MLLPLKAVEQHHINTPFIATNLNTMALLEWGDLKPEFYLEWGI